VSLKTARKGLYHPLVCKAREWIVNAAAVECLQEAVTLAENDQDTPSSPLKNSCKSIKSLYNDVFM
jgi:hypothetical protein